MSNLHASRPRLLPSIVLSVLLIGSGSVVAALLYSLRQDPPRRALGALPPLVRTVVVTSETITEQYIGYGTVAARRKARISSEVSGRVVEIVDRVRAGSVVRSGQVLVRIDDRDYQQQLRRAEALATADLAALDELALEESKLGELLDTVRSEMRSARSEWLRVSDLFERDLAANKEYDTANTALQRTLRVLQGYELEQARIGPRRRRQLAAHEANLAEVQRAKIVLQRCTIEAPFSGSLQRMEVEVGDLMAPGTPVATLVDTSHVEVGLQLPAFVRDRIELGSRCVLRSESQPDSIWEGIVARISPTIDERSRTFAAYVEIDNAAQPQPCIPGSFVRSEVFGPTHVDVLLIPRGALRDGFIIVADGGVARRREVDVQRLIHDRAIISGDVHDGDHVVLSHLSQLKDGSPLRLMPREPAVGRASTGAGAAPDGSNTNGVLP